MISSPVPPGGTSPPGVHHPGLGVEQGAASAGVGPGADLLGGAVDASRSALGLAARLDQLDVRQRRAGGPDRGGRHRGGAEQANPPGRQIPVRQAGLTQHQLVHRGHAEEHGDAVLLQGLQHGLRGE
jgi:hypothetical protein